ncbi:hypothetical protein IFM89_001106 [Coptis chinensis]|uniref:C2H2-type domain-containing protein n=1 Tax=Coptis chinensis TaxID=261450 RepID=A0A835M3L1_9MAGN|nr:hypothetical protein IFM89_001106 [Coptis chinensis]
MDYNKNHRKHTTASSSSSSSEKPTSSPAIGTISRAIKAADHQESYRSSLYEFIPSLHRDHPNNALVHRVEAEVYARIETWKQSRKSLQLPLSGKKDFLTLAMECARRATVLAPSSIEYAWYLAHLQFAVAQESMLFNDYRLSIQLSKAALAIGDASDDPSKENLLFPQKPNQNAQERINLLKAKLSYIIDTSTSHMHLMRSKSLDYWLGSSRIMKVGLGCLKNYYETLGIDSALQLILESLSFAAEYEQWCFWVCCMCGKRLVHPHLLHDHVWQTHLPIICPAWRLLIGGSWKKVETRAAIQKIAVEEDANVGLIPNEKLELVLKFLHELSRKVEDKGVVERVLGTNVSFWELNEMILLDGESLCICVGEDLIVGDTCQTTEEVLVSWTSLRSQWNHLGENLFQAIQNCSNNMQNLLDRKCDQSSYKEALHSLLELCHKETKLSNRQVIETRLEELVQGRDSESCTVIKSKLEALSMLLNLAQSVEEEEVVKGLGTDTVFLEAIRSLLENVELELAKIDASLIESNGEILDLADKITSFAADDYRRILFPLVKVYLHKQIESFAEVYAYWKPERPSPELLSNHFTGFR